MLLLALFLLFKITIFTAHPTEEKNSNEKLDYWTPFLKSQKHLEELAQEASKFADQIVHYEYVYNDEHRDKPDYKPIAPMTLFPSKFPRALFDLAQALQPAMNLLYFRASIDHKFLSEIFKETAKGDESVRNMLSILEEVQNEGGHRQAIAVQLQRADYMCHVGNKQQADKQPQIELKQIEVNNGNGGGPPMAMRQTMVHRKTLTHLGADASLEVLRDNHPYTTHAEALYLAWLKFGDPAAIMVQILGIKRKKIEPDGGKTPKPKPKAQILDIDLEKELARLSGGQLKYVDMSLEMADVRLKLDPEDYSLRMNDGRKVALVYFRYNVFETEKEWRARRLIELSTAIKAPTIGMELMGTKKGQQTLAKSGVLEQFFPNPEEAHYISAIRKSFAELWSLENAEDEETKRVIQDAKKHTELYVMKPMKEGGGNNIFGQDIAHKLITFSDKQRAAHILMQRLQPMAVPNYFVRSYRKPEMGMVVPELGMFGALVGDVQDGTVLHNHAGGYLVRTKWSHSDEGGVLVGAGAYDSPYLY